MIKKTSNILPGFQYFIKGDNPTLLIHSGTHGDEFEVIDFVKKAVEKYEDKLPDFVFVPVVSPSAVFAKTRHNLSGKDLNRVFFFDSEEAEVQENIKVLNGYTFNLMVSFHEDPESFDYYIYDEGLNQEESQRVLAHNQNLKKLGINLLNGVDDPDDPILGIEFTEGYRKFKVSSDIPNNGMITSWAISGKRVKDTLVPEIPGKLSLDKKEIIVDSFFKDVLL